MSQDYLSEHEVQSFADKLVTFGQSLSAREQQCLANLLICARNAAAGDTGQDVTPYSVDQRGILIGLRQVSEHALPRLVGDHKLSSGYKYNVLSNKRL